MNNANNFFQIAYDIYGTYNDSLLGFYCLRNKIVEIQNKSNLPIAEMDERKFTYGKGNPNKESS